MEALRKMAAAFLAELEGREVPRELLGRLGDPDPERSVGAFTRAIGHPDLAPTVESWLPALLRSARPGFGAASLEDLARRHREHRSARLDLGRMPTLPLVLGCSNFLTRLLLARPEWVDGLVGDLPAAPSGAPPTADWSAIRTAKYRGLLCVAARDLAGRPFPESFAELSDLADGCLDAALRCAQEETGVAPTALLALGKLGGRELNFSSDVDLLFVYEAAAGAPDLERNQEVGRLVRQLKAELERPTELGFAYRVDLDLRPEGRTGVIANSVDAALSYYESFGAEWERQALIRLRHVTGPRPAAEAFLKGVAPFIYRRSIGPEVLRAVREMKARIESERRRAGRDVESDLKEGAGGIRDVEFLVQALQLFYGGREGGLRTGNVLEALARLEATRILPPETAAGLRDAYVWLRRAEHAVQLVDERQTHVVPREARARLALARRMGYLDPQGERACARMLDDWTTVRAEVRMHFEELILEGAVDSDP